MKKRIHLILLMLCLASLFTGCTMRTVEKEGIEAEPRQMRVRNPETGRNELISEMTYEEWAGWKDVNRSTSADSAASITTRAEATSYLRRVFSEINGDMGRIDNEVLVENINQFKRLNDKFGALSESNRGVFAVERSGQTHAAVRGTFRNLDQQSLSLGTEHFGRGRDALISSAKKESESNWSMRCKAENYSVYTITHEYGHILHNTIIRSRVDINDFEKRRSEVLISKNGISKAEKMRKTESDKHAKAVFKEVLDIAKESNSEFSLSANISRYGKTDYYEAFAEVFANSQLGDPNELGLAMNVWLERQGYK